jgi:flagellar assembly factor FliW
MKILTDILGEIEYSEEDIIVFSEGLYGFSEYKQFIIINVAGIELPFQWLQSVEDGTLSFVMTTPFAFCSAYDFEIQDNVVEQLRISSPDDVVVNAFVVLSENLEESTLNLKAPILINTKSRTGKQVILNEDYPYKFKFFKQTGLEG